MWPVAVAFLCVSVADCCYCQTAAICFICSTVGSLAGARSSCLFDNETKHIKQLNESANLLSLSKFILNEQNHCEKDLTNHFAASAAFTQSSSHVHFISLFFMNCSTFTVCL